MDEPLLFSVVEMELPSAAGNASDNPFGSVGVIGMYRPPASAGCQCDE